MKVVKLLVFGRELLKLMSICGLKVEDYRYIELYSEYVKKRMNREKYSVIIMELSEKYEISESSVKRIIRRFDVDI